MYGNWRRGKNTDGRMTKARIARAGLTTKEFGFFPAENGPPGERANITSPFIR